MKRILLLLQKHFFDDALDYRVRIFNTLAFIGIAAGVIFFFSALFLEGSIVNALTNLLASVFAIGLLLFAKRSGQYQLCFVATVVVVFMVLFPILFFTTGGYHSGMPAFFVFAVGFTVLMLEGWWRNLFVLAELVLYASICVYSYLVPSAVNPFASEMDAAMDIVISFVAASFALALAIGQHIAVYRRKQERLEQLDREKTELFGEISHEMKTPLAVVSSLAYSMREKLEDIPQAQGAVADAMLIATEADRLAMLVSQVLDLAQISEGRMVRQKAACHIDEIIHSAMATHFSISLNQNRIDIKIDDGLSPVWADAPRIEQVIVNLVANAERHTSNGRIVISARQHGAYVSISVADNGRGIPKDQIPLIFERYYTGSSDTGTGLGLYICKHIVQAHDGRLGVESQLGQGSTFRFTLPAYQGRAQ